MATNFRALQKELRQRVRIPAYSSILDSDESAAQLYNGFRIATSAQERGEYYAC